MHRRSLIALILTIAALALPAAASAAPEPLYRWSFEGSDPGLQYFNGAAAGAPGAIGSAARFDGVDDYAAVPVVLAGAGGVPYDAITVELWLNWDQYADDDGLALELSPNANQHAGTFAVAPDDKPPAGQTGRFFVGSQNSVDDWNDNRFARPSAGTWHHYAIVITRNVPAPFDDTVRVWVDGVEQPQQGSTVPFTHEFANQTLYLMSRGGTSLFGTGSIDELAIYASALTASEIAEHADVRPETTITGGPEGSGSAAAATFSFASDDPGASFECRIDDQAFAPCTSPMRYPSLALGDHAFQVRAVSQLSRADASPATRSFTLVPEPATEPSYSASHEALGPQGVHLAGLRLPTRAASDRTLSAALRRCSAKRGSARRAACRRAARERLLPTMSFTLDRSSRVTFTLRRWANGRTATFSFAGVTGSNRVRWRTRVGNVRLARGRYTLTVTLQDGSHSRAVKSLTVTVR